MASGIHIKPENKGKFTAFAKSKGMGVQQAARHVLANKDRYSSTIVKRANFARNASKWKHEDGGYIEGMPVYNYGGYMMLPEYGFGSWLKDNAGGLLKGASSLVSLIPGVGQIASPILNVAGSAISGLQQQKADQAQADKAQEQLDLAAEQQAQAESLRGKQMRSAQIQQASLGLPSYGSSIAYEMGGDIGMGLMGEQAVITQYSNKADKHSEGIGGIPVDVRGNPAKTSKQSAVALTEGGEVTWNGYVFSNKLKVK